MKKLLIVAHAPSSNTQQLATATLTGAQRVNANCRKGEINLVIEWIPPLQATAADVLSCDAIILGTTENLGYMSGALKDFFDRIYYPCLEAKQGMPFGFYIRAGHDGTGTQKAIQSICQGLKWKQVQPELICRGEWQVSFVTDCESLGENVACGLECGVY
ncbi:MAG: hypothetical protein OFPII_18890 [Osedax symbiont Rs1]|nr:MAG: hypothetical protein OFPII_18890 [Osedax symbiont Rs1]